jgi:hypothetical protein
MNTKEYFYFIIPTYFRLTSFIVVGSPHGILTPHLLHSFPLSTNHHQTAHHHHTWHTKRTKKLKKKKGRRISCAVQRASKTKDNDPFLPVQSWNLSNTKTIRTSSHHNPFSPLVVGFPCEKLEPICREENSDTRTLHDLSSSPAFKSYHAIISINNSQ